MEELKKTDLAKDRAEKNALPKKLEATDAMNKMLASQMMAMKVEMAQLKGAGQ